MGIWRGAAAMAAVLLAAACGGNGGGSGEAMDDTAPAAEAGAGELTSEELEKGIGPIREVELGAIDDELAERGEEAFRTKCSACHRLEEQYVAPELGDVLERRTPEYVMNMILNPAEMVQRHPAAQELLAQFMTQMPDQNLSEDEARAILEYIRAEAAEDGGAGTDQ